MKKFPTAFTILFGLIVVVAALTWIIPAGQSERAMNETLGREAPVPGTYAQVEPNPQGLGAVLMAPIAGLYDPATGMANAIDVAVFVLVIGAFLAVVTKTGAIHAGIGWLLNALKRREIRMIPIPAVPLATRRSRLWHRGMGRSSSVLAALMVAVVLPSLASAQTLERVRESGVVRLGHRHDAPPFSFVGPDGTPAGYTIELCKKVVDAIGQAVGREVLPEYVELTTEERFRAVEEGKVDLLCGADTVTLGRRETVSFTVPVFLTGISAVLSANAPRYLNEVIAGRAALTPSRAAVLQAIRHKTFGVRSGTTAETWLRGYVARFGGTAEVDTVDDHAVGIAGVASGAFDAYFADRPLLLGQLQTVENPDQFVLSDRLFTFEPYAIALPRGDEDLRLVADRTLSHFFASPEYLPFFQGYFGTPDDLQKLSLTIGTIPD